MPSKFFICVSRLNGLVLDVAGANRSPGASVIMFHRKQHDNLNQQWYEDVSTHTIRSRLNDFCLEIGGDGTLVMNPFNPASNQQKWELKGKKGIIQSLHNSNMVVDIKGENKNPQAQLCVWNFKNSANQLWNFDFLEPDYFVIVSEMHDKVLEVKDANPAPGTRVCMNRPNGGTHQQWFESKKGIRSRLNDLPLTSGGVLCDGAILMVKPTGTKEKPDNHFFVLSGNKIVNKADATFVCDIAGAIGTDGADVIAHKYEGKSYQHWRYQPVK